MTRNLPDLFNPRRKGKHRAPSGLSRLTGRGAARAAEPPLPGTCTHDLIVCACTGGAS